MASIVAQDVSLHLPLYNYHARSLKKSLLNMSTGGKVSVEAKSVVIEALRNITFEFKNGDRVGLIGRNGAGKSTLLRLMTGVYQPTGGAFTLEGRVIPLLSVGLGMLEEFTGYENIMSGGLHVGMTREEITAKRDEIAEFTELGDYLDLPLSTYSTGMRTRLSFAIATSINPDILLLDEVIGAGDAGFARKAAERFESLISRSNILVIASHSEEWILNSCNKAMLLDGGNLIKFGDVREVVDAYHELLGV